MMSNNMRCVGASRGGGKDNELRAALAAATITDVGNHGLDAISLRRVSAAVGRSTSAIFQHFGSKSELLVASVESALADESAFHTAFAAGLDGLQLGHDALADTVALYIERRAADTALRLWPEILFKSAQAPELIPALRQWHALRVDFWRGLCSTAAAPDVLAALLSTYVTMEEAYAGVLHGELGYRLHLRETAARLLDTAFGHAESLAPVTTWREVQAVPPPPPVRDGEVALADRLLDLAAGEILQHGVSALNHRRLTALAGVSAAMIIYHFDDMANFSNAAIWQALLRGLPSYLELHGAPGTTRQTLAEWSESLGETVRLPEATGSGFYVGYARIVGQVCLLARRDPTFVPLVHYLRGIEGTGTYRAGRTSWPATLEMGRATATGFAIWIKGYAILNEAIGKPGPGANDGECLYAAAQTLLASHVT